MVLKDGELRFIVINRVRCAVRDLAPKLIGVGDRGHVLDKLDVEKVEQKGKNKTKNK